MKKGIITMMALMLGISGMTAQNTLVVAGSGDATIKQGDNLEVKCEGEPVSINNDEKIVLSSYKDYSLTLPTLKSIRITGSGDLQGVGTLRVPNLDVLITGTGDANLDVESDTIRAILTGIGDLNLTGHSRYLEANITGLGDLNLNDFTADSLNIKKTGIKDIHISLPEGDLKHESLIFDPNWSGFEAGLNLLLGPGPNAEFTDYYAPLNQRTLSSWNFNFNIVDIGVAFTHAHRAGVYTGLGLAWNTFRLNTPVRLETGEENLICNPIDEAVEGHVKRSKLCVLYIQVPLMIEMRPFPKYFITVGVTGGIRIDAWNKVNFENYKIVTEEDFFINRFKLDASLRIGRNNSLGVYANYNLLPFFVKSKVQNAHCLSFGLSLNF